MLQLTNRRMTRAQLEATPAYRRCSRKEQFFLQTLIQGFLDTGITDPVFATQSAYSNEGESARCMSYAILKTKKIRDVHSIYENFGKSAETIRREAKKAAQEQYIETVKAELDAARPGSTARTRLVELYGTLMFGTKVSKSTKTKRKRK